MCYLKLNIFLLMMRHNYVPRKVTGLTDKTLHVFTLKIPISKLEMAYIL